MSNMEPSKLFSNIHENKDFNRVTQDKSKMIEGVNLLGDTVGATLGAQGRTTLVETATGVYSTKDGSYTANQINVKDREMMLAIKAVRQSARRTAEIEGDGTTTCTVLAQAIINNIYKHSPDPSVALINDVIDAVKAVDKELGVLSKRFNKKSMLKIATTSANNDVELGKLVTGIYNEVGVALGMTFEYHPNALKTRAEVIKGSMLPLGLYNNEFINHLEAEACVLHNPYILVSNAEIPKTDEIKGILEFVAESGRPLLIIANTTGDVDAALIANKQKKIMMSCVINPAQCYNQELLKDLALLTGATYFDATRGEALDTIDHTYLGEAESITVRAGQTIVTIENPSDVSKELEYVNKKLKEDPNVSEKRTLQDRLAVLQGGFGKVIIGAPTEVEAKEIRDRVEDSIKAVSASLDGYLPGGGSALYYISEMLWDDSCSDGCKILLESIKEPLKRICQNAGVEKFNPNKLKKYEGINVLTGKVGNMEDFGIIDPTNVTRAALRNALSSAITLMRTGSVIVNTDNDE